MGGVLAILSGVILVVFFAKLDELVSRQYYNLFQVTKYKPDPGFAVFCFQTEISRGSLTLMAGCIVLSILVNILLILGGEDRTLPHFYYLSTLSILGTGRKWRRTLTIPWLVFYGAGIIISLSTYLHFTSKCWREEKVERGGVLSRLQISLLSVDWSRLSLHQLHLPHPLDLGLARRCSGHQTVKVDALRKQSFPKVIAILELEIALYSCL